MLCKQGYYLLYCRVVIQYNKITLLPLPNGQFLDNLQRVITLSYKHQLNTKLKSFVTIYMLNSLRITLFFKLLM